MTMTIEKAKEILADVLAQPDWRKAIWKIQQEGPTTGWDSYVYTKGRGAPHTFTNNEKGLRARAAYRIQQELSNPFLEFGKRRLTGWNKRQASRLERKAEHERLYKR